MIEFQYDEKTYRKMSVRIGWWIYAVMFGIIFAILAGICGKIIADNVREGKDWIYSLISAGLFLVILAVLVAALIVGMRKQLAKSFAMYSANGVLLQRAEIVGDEIIVTNVSRQNVTRINTRDIASVKKYKDFFVVNTNTKSKWAVPFDEQTRKLYDALTGKTDISQLAKETKNTADGSLADEKVVQQPAIPFDPNALSFEYELSEQQAVNMLTKVISVRFRSVLASLILFAVVTAVYLALMLISYLTGDEILTRHIIMSVVCACGTVFFAVAYANKNKSGRVSGENYFKQQSKDGQCKLRVELYDQGIVTFNVLRDTRTLFRLADMEAVKLFNDFFYVEFTSKEVLPIPLTDDTRRLYDILNNAIKPAQGKKR